MELSVQPDGSLPSGVVVRGSYVIDNIVGDGGMGIVYQCHHKVLGTRYALKVLDSKLARMDVIRRRFLAEAKIQATVIHPHIVHVMDVIDGEKDGGIPGLLAMVMEFVEGESLDDVIARAPLSERDAVSCALVILDAIGFAHHAGIVHRDLKPSNIMISREQSRDAMYRGVKVMDFGIAKLLQENEQRTVTGAKMGTPRYMAPEQIENARDVDERTDLYAIGLTLYEALCGRTPFEEYKEFELWKAQLTMKPPPMRTFRDDLSDRLESIVMKALEKDRANRYPNAESFQRALLSLGGYDDIALRLNPNDGVAVVTSNPKLQRKIERAIAKREETGKCGKNGKPRTVRAMASLDCVQSRVLSPSSGTQVSGQAERALSLASGVDAYGRTALEGKPVKRRQSVVELSKKNPSGHTFRRAKSADAHMPVKRAHGKPEGSAAGTAPSVLKDGGRSCTSSGIGSKMAENALAHSGMEGKPCKKRAGGRPALKIALCAVVLLFVVGIAYRYVHDMPFSADISKEARESEAILERDVEDVSQESLAYMDTPTGRMTVVPAALHWVGAGRRGGLQRKKLGAFAVDQNEVSQYQYLKCVEAGVCAPLGIVGLDLNVPVTGIGFGSAEAFCTYAGKRLPTEEEWEAAARFGGDGDGLTGVSVTCESVHCGAMKSGECRKWNPEAPQSVFSRAGWGNPGHLLNILGNVREWTTTRGQDPQKRVTKGGSFRSPKSEIKISAQKLERANGGADDLGFRCVKDL